MNSREIKFRFWDGYEFFYSPSLIGIQEDYEDIETIDGLLNHKEFIAQQYTGCFDRNNKEIYVGDIVSHKGYNGVVSFFAGMFIIDYPDQTDSGPIGFLQILDMEVVGNKFENKDLLK